MERNAITIPQDASLTRKSCRRTESAGDLRRRAAWDSLDASKCFNLRAQIDPRSSLTPGSSSYPMSATWKNHALRGSSATRTWRGAALAQVTGALKKRLLLPGCSIVDLPPNADEKQRKSWEAYGTANFAD